MLALAARLAGTDAPEAERREAATRLRRYFTEALPKHVAEEEELCAGLDLPEVAAMSAEHVAHEPVVARLVAIAREIEAGGAVPAELAEVAAALEAAFVPHLEVEERVIFPALRARRVAPPR